MFRIDVAENPEILELGLMAAADPAFAEALVAEMLARAGEEAAAEAEFIADQAA